MFSRAVQTYKPPIWYLRSDITFPDTLILLCSANMSAIAEAIRSLSWSSLLTLATLHRPYLNAALVQCKSFLPSLDGGSR